MQFSLKACIRKTDRLFGHEKMSSSSSETSGTFPVVILTLIHTTIEYLNKKYSVKFPTYSNQSNLLKKLALEKTDRVFGHEKMSSSSSETSGTFPAVILTLIRTTIFQF